MYALRRLKANPKVRFAPAPQPFRSEGWAYGEKTASSTFGAPLSRTITQEQQDEQDEEKRREAMRDLVESWMDRLQLISVITTFFASTEASMLTITAPSSSGTPMSITAQVANVGIIGALVVHSNAAIISFLAAFFLIRYKLKVAKSEEKEAGVPGSPGTVGPNGKHHPGSSSPVVESPRPMSPSDLERSQSGPGVDHEHDRGLHPPRSEHETDPIPGPIQVSTSTPFPRAPPGSSYTGQTSTIWSTNPHLVQVGPLGQQHPPTHLLSRCHSLCLILSALGFALALMGILCFAWDRLPLSASVSASFFMLLCLVTGVWILFAPEPGEGVMSPHIYFLGDS